DQCQASLKRLDSFGDALDRGFDKIHRGRYRDSKVRGQAVGRTLDDRNPCLLEQVEREVIVATDDGAARATTADQCRAIGIEIESPLRRPTGETRNLTQQFKRTVAPGLEFERLWVNEILR